MKYYQVIFVDEYNNFFEIGPCAKLSDAEPEVNKYLEGYVLSEDAESGPGETPEFGEGKNLGRLTEYPSTFSMVFDRTIDVEEGYVQVRGFIKDTDETIKELQELAGEKNG